MKRESENSVHGEDSWGHDFGCETPFLLRIEKMKTNWWKFWGFSFFLSSILGFCRNEEERGKREWSGVERREKERETLLCF